MDKFTTFTGLAAPLFRPNVDTDQIIPKQFLTRIERTGYGAFLFNDWRYERDGMPKADFVLNSPRYAEASVLIAGPNFGCGSSREHAAWSLTDFGFRVVIAPSFGDIFYNNSLKNGLLPVRLAYEVVEQMAQDASKIDGYTVTVNLLDKRVSDSRGVDEHFEIDEFRRDCLLRGLDDIGLTLQHEELITKFEEGLQSPQISFRSSRTSVQAYKIRT